MSRGRDELKEYESFDFNFERKLELGGSRPHGSQRGNGQSGPSSYHPAE